MGFLSKLFGKKTPVENPSPPEKIARPTAVLDLAVLSERLKVPLETVRATPLVYHEMRIAKRDGTTRILQVPDQPLKTLQRTILRRLLAKLSAHTAAKGFEQGQSIATNASPHVGAAVVLKLDLQDFFTRTLAGRIEAYFQRIGWNTQAAALLTALTTYQGSLPQGAPTSPRLSNLVNHHLDERLYSMAASLGATYTRYADDMTFSIPSDSPPRPSQNLQARPVEHKPARAADRRATLGRILWMAKSIVEDEGYELHLKKKLRIASRHDRMLVTGLVVNEKLNLPRATRRRLRAVEHHLATNRPATLTAVQLQGWKGLQSMIKDAR